MTTEIDLLGDQLTQVLGHQEGESVVDAARRVVAKLGQASRELADTRARMAAAIRREEALAAEAAALRAEVQVLKESNAEYERELASQPARWFVDSSLETWFPFTAAKLDWLEEQVARIARDAFAYLSWAWDPNSDQFSAARAAVQAMGARLNSRTEPAPFVAMAPQDWLDSRQAGRHLGGPDDDHYAVLGVQPIEVTEAWAKTWPPGVAYHLGEAVACIARCGTKGQAVRDLTKAAWMLKRAVEVIEREGKS